MATSAVHLEQYVENATTLPSELSRFLGLIKVLDEKVAGLMDSIKGCAARLMELPPVVTLKREDMVSLGSCRRQPGRPGALGRAGGR
jgi:hypothetical protein